MISTAVAAAFLLGLLSGVLVVGGAILRRASGKMELMDGLLTELSCEADMKHAREEEFHLS